jgi:Zn-dependent protease
MTEIPSLQKNKTLPGTIIALIVAAAVKFKSLIWLVGSLSTMILSIGVFAMGYGLPYAISLVMLIFIHEGGHWLWMKVLGLKPKAPMFIPGLGAFVAMTNLPPSEALHAWVALAGPLIGGLGCAILYSIGVHTSNGWLMASGNTGFMLNLLQLVPAKPLDGGFVVQAVSRWILIPGTIALFIAGATCASPLILLIAVVSLLSFGRRPQIAQTKQEVVGDTTVANTVKVPQSPAKTWERFAIAFGYLSLVGALSFGYLLSLSELNIPAH